LNKSFEKENAARWHACRRRQFILTGKVRQGFKKKGFKKKDLKRKPQNRTSQAEGLPPLV
jgi:hypothetical protein